MALAVLCIGFQFVCTKAYQQKAGGRFLSVMIFNIVAGAVSALLFFCLGGFDIRINVFSTCMGIGFAFCMTVINCVTIFAVSCGKVSVYTLFMMLGGMFLPFSYGCLFLDEKVGVCRIIALVLIVIAVVLPCMAKSEGKSKKRFYLFCVFAFVLNGAIGIVTKAHQINVRAVDTYSFLTWAYCCVFVLSGAICAVYGIARKCVRKVAPEPVRADNVPSAHRSWKPICNLAFIAGYAVFNGLCNMFQMLGARTLPAVLLYPVTTGGSIVLTAVLGRIVFREKITKLVALGISLAFAATVLFLF